MDEYKKRIGNVIRVYKSGGFTVKTIHADPEFKRLRDHLMDTYGIKSNFCKCERARTRSRANYSDYQRTGAINLPQNSIRSDPQAMDQVFGNNNSGKAEFRARKKRNIQILQP